ncbi:hypothetical protein KC678_01325 [Candidatus Dojkabacteria bacterium]|uniref:Cohesin domain-containing protein n=1 Tax=Candidatus Dojkabacteria bacterium TaxID=2099670 RepID=A0A955L135_9BACT|nr:hypothetical protein [Candidatus Dojkabacteria bacterium]
MDLKELIIPSVNAQAVDALSQPTFGPIDVGSNSSQTGSVLVSADKTQVEVGDLITVTVSVNTNGTPISEYRITVDFDATKFTVIDTDTETEGTQVTLVDPVFTIENPVEDNTVSSLGRIRVIAKSEEQLSINRNVIEFQLQAQAPGLTSLRVITEGDEPTQLVREAGVGLSYTGNEVSMTIQSDTVVPEPTTPEPTTPTTQEPTTQSPTYIPDTAIEDYLPQAIPVLFGVFLLVLGVSLLRKKEEDQLKNRN